MRLNEKLTSNLSFYGCQECVDATDELGCRPCGTVQCELLGAQKVPEKNGERGKLGQDRLEVRWEAVMFSFNLVI